jgi:hypothetical protein
MAMYHPTGGGSPHPLCDPAASLVHMVEQTILAKFTPDQRVSPEQVEAAQDLLQNMYEKRAATLDLGHYPAAYGSHQCLTDVIDALSFRISALGLMQPEKEHAPDPATRQAPHSAADVVTNLRRLAEEQRRRRGTYLGQEIPQPPPESTR